MLNRIKKFVRTNVLYRQKLGASGESWKNSDIPQKQLKAVAKQLQLLHNGTPPPVFMIVSEALNIIPRDKRRSLLEVGCASGYYSEVIAALNEKRFEYTGADYSEAMINLAREQYPDSKFITCDIRDIDLKDRAFDVVLSGAVLVHVKEWQEAVRELCRLAGSYLVLHRTPITGQAHYRVEKKIYGGSLFFLIPLTGKN